MIELPSAAAAHLAKVLRARSGDELVLFAGDGREFAATVESVRGSRVTAAVGEGRRSRPRVAARGHARAMHTARRSHGFHRAKSHRTRRRAHRSGLEPAQRGASRRAAGGIQGRALACDRRQRLRTMRPQSPAGHRRSAAVDPLLGDSPAAGPRLLLEPELESRGRPPRGRREGGGRGRTGGRLRRRRTRGISRVGLRRGETGTPRSCAPRRPRSRRSLGCRAVSAISRL